METPKSPDSPRSPTLALAMIVRDVASYIEPCLDSILPYVDELIIGDTGSKDINVSMDVIRLCCNKHKKTYRILDLSPQAAPELFILDTPATFAGMEGADDLKEFSKELILANYAKARQSTFDCATSDFVMWIDSDDIVENATYIPTILKTMVDEEIDTAMLDYDYEKNEQGNVVNRLLRLRIIRRDTKPTWTQPIHEVLGPVGKSQVFREVRVVHQLHSLFPKISEAVRPAQRNYKVLLHELARTKRDGETTHPRIWFYLGNESRAFNEDASIAYFRKYIAASQWDEEKALAHIYIGQMHEGHGRLEKARGEYAVASCIFPDKPESHLGLARIAHYFHDHEACVRYHKTAELAMHFQRDTLHYNPYDRLFYPAISNGPSFMALGDYKKVVELTSRALTMEPNSTHLHGLKAAAQKKIDLRWRSRSIAIWTGNALEEWTPDSVNSQGIGGSETAAVHMAEQLSRLGHKVIVYSHCGSRAKFGDVEYVPYMDAVNQGYIESDVFISSRQTQIFQIDIRAAKKIIWCHDNDVGPSSDPDVCKNLLKAEFLLALSQWHRNQLLATYPFLHPKRVIVTSNGIDTNRYKDEPVKIGNRLIYSSSPDRGLGTLLEAFPEIRKQVPDAELHVYYGFDNYLKMIERFPDTDDRKSLFRGEIAMLMNALENTEGVTHHGRVGQQELSQAQLASKLWTYPTHFSESSCITAMEVQAAACTPVTTELAALAETVHHGFMFKPPAGTPKYMDYFIKRVVWCLTHEKERADIAARGRIEAFKIHSWSRVANDWNDMFARMFDTSFRPGQA